MDDELKLKDCAKRRDRVSKIVLRRVGAHRRKVLSASNLSLDQIIECDNIKFSRLDAFRTEITARDLDEMGVDYGPLD